MSNLIRKFFRHETIYKWNDNWTPYSLYLDASDYPILPGFTCDDEHYYKINSFSCNVKMGDGIRTLAPMYLNLYRGGSLIATWPYGLQTQSNQTRVVFMGPHATRMSTAWNPVLDTVATPDHYYLIPGDILLFESDGFILGDSFTLIVFNARRWRLR